MKAVQLLLVSQSPRRREMITWLNLPVNSLSADINECPHQAESPLDMTVRLARLKAHHVTAAPAHTWILAADTVVDLGNVPLGKPSDPAEARAMLRRLRARSHAVHTTVTLYDPHTHQDITRYVTTGVEMRAYTDAEIEAYIASHDPLDKAGAYAIQNSNFHPVTHLNRCYANVVGLPLCAVSALLEAWGFFPSAPIPALCRAHFDYSCPAVDTGVRL
ncbi:MAG TPA: Maf family protein [Anaerolineae bacterium]|nr:Maf family protein [Anaerolineae bacterium]HQH38815.1 Maf family protein [Anaerolineae bacterium]